MRKVSILACLIASALLALPSFAQPITLETKWTQKTFSISTTGVTSLTIDVAGFGAAGYNLPGTTRTLNGVDGTVYGATVTATTADVNIVGFSWSGLAIGGSASMRISQTVKTPPARGSANASSAAFNSPFPGANNFSVPLISTSSAIVFPNSVSVSEKFSAQTTNPVFTFTGLTSAATLYFSLDYGVPKVQ